MKSQTIDSSVLGSSHARVSGALAGLKLGLVLILLAVSGVARAEEAPVLERGVEASVQPAVVQPVVEAAAVPSEAEAEKSAAVSAPSETVAPNIALRRDFARKGAFGVGLILGNLSTIQAFVPNLSIYPRLALSGKYYWNEHVASQFQVSRGTLDEVGGEDFYYAAGTTLLLETQLTRLGEHSLRGNVGAGPVVWQKNGADRMNLSLQLMAGLSMAVPNTPVELLMNFGLNAPLLWISSAGVEDGRLEFGDFYQVMGIGARCYFR